jgi:hypothetical protein
MFKQHPSGYSWDFPDERRRVFLERRGVVRNNSTDRNAVLNGVPGDWLVRKTGHGIGRVLRCARMVLNLEDEFRKPEPPSREPPLYVG